MRKMTAIDYFKVVGEMILMGIPAAIGFATWIAIGLFIYCLVI